MTKLKSPKTGGGAYTVGYAKPPKQHQFKPGKSGNPKGRPKGVAPLYEVLLAEAAKLVTVKSGDLTLQAPKRQLLMRRLIDIGLQGDVGALRLALQLLGLAEAAMAEKTAGAPPPLTEDQIGVLQLFAAALEAKDAE